MPYAPNTGRRMTGRTTSTTATTRQRTPSTAVSRPAPIVRSPDRDLAGAYTAYNTWTNNPQLPGCRPPPSFYR